VRWTPSFWKYEKEKEEVGIECQLRRERAVYNKGASVSLPVDLCLLGKQFGATPVLSIFGTDPLGSNWSIETEAQSLYVKWS
jgi:hypothetical protein